MQALHFRGFFFFTFLWILKEKIVLLAYSKYSKHKQPAKCSKLYMNLLLPAYYLHVTFITSKILINYKINNLNMKTRNKG